MKTDFSMRPVMGGLLGGDYTAPSVAEAASPPNTTFIRFSFLGSG